MRAILVILSLLALAACGTHELATCHGPTFALNPGMWEPTQASLTIPGKTP